MLACGCPTTGWASPVTSTPRIVLISSTVRTSPHDFGTGRPPAVSPARRAGALFPDPAPLAPGPAPGDRPAPGRGRVADAPDRRRRGRGGGPAGTARHENRDGDEY